MSALGADWTRRDGGNDVNDPLRKSGEPGEICNPGLIGVIGDPSVLAKFEDGQKLEWFGGIEGRLVGNWTAKIEYLYLDLGTVSTIPAPAPSTTTAAAFNSRVTDNLLRVGVNYKFDPNDIWAFY
jgi:outer membrane immunogenic protein